MKVKLIGTGAILTQYLSACVLIDNDLIVDIPNGVIKNLRKMKIDLSKIDICLLTHLHGDHYFDLPFLLLEQGLRTVRDYPLQVIGPPGTNYNLERLFKMAFSDNWEKIVENTKLKIIEISDGNVINLNNPSTKIEAIRVNHQDMEAFGYLITRANKILGYTGDTILCEGVKYIFSQSHMVIADMAFIQSKSGHMGLEDVLQLMNNYHCKVIPTHMTDDVRKAAQSKILIPSDGDEFEL